MQTVRRPHAQNLVRWAKDRPECLVLSADLTSSCEVDDFREAYPDRFLSLGMAEQNMMSFAAGLAREGLCPMIHTFAVFICRRPFDQLAMSVAYPNLRVRMFGFLPGITTPGGATHQAIDDVALMRIVPNMTVLECGDATDVESVLDVAHSVDGPVYIRMLRGDVPRLFPAKDAMQLGRARTIANGSDVAILSSGICTEEVMKATGLLNAVGVTVRHLHITTHKPFDDPQVLEALDAASLGVVTVENHTVIGGLGSAVAECMAEAGLGKKLIRLAIPDQFAHGASRDYLLKKYRLDAFSVVQAVESLSGIPLGISESDIPESAEIAADTLAKAEDL